MKKMILKENENKNLVSFVEIGNSGLDYTKYLDVSDVKNIEWNTQNTFYIYAKITVKSVDAQGQHANQYNRETKQPTNLLSGIVIQFKYNTDKKRTFSEISELLNASDHTGTKIGVSNNGRLLYKLLYDDIKPQLTNIIRKNAKNASTKEEFASTRDAINSLEYSLAQGAGESVDRDDLYSQANSANKGQGSDFDGGVKKVPIIKNEAITYSRMRTIIREEIYKVLSNKQQGIENEKNIK